MNTRYTVKFRRRREGKTDYHRRVKLLTSQKSLLVFRKLSRTLIGQITQFNPKGDKILVNVNSKELEKYGWKLSKKNTPAAYLTGFLIAKKAGKSKAGNLIADFGIINPTKGSVKYAFLKGASDGGLNVMHSPDFFPEENRIKGEHIASYSSNPEYKNITRIFEEVKSKIESQNG